MCVQGWPKDGFIKALLEQSATSRCLAAGNSYCKLDAAPPTREEGDHALRRVLIARLHWELLQQLTLEIWHDGGEGRGGERRGERGR